MQSGIKASSELLTAFNSFVSSPDQRALFADISNESLVPSTVIPLGSSSDFNSDLHQLQPHLSPTKAAYVLLKTHPGAPDGYVAVTFVPNAAPVKQKMLFASTRLSLVRELGTERFRQTIFATEKNELTAAGWAIHEAHTSLDAPLTEEETLLGGVKDAEAAESQGTSTRRGHVAGAINIKVGSGVVEALALLKQDGCRGTLVQLKYQLPGEILVLDASADNISPEKVPQTIHASEPRYSFYSHPAAASSAAPEIIFIYTCPTSSKVKERMIYSTGKSWTRTVAERDAGVVVAKSLEATEPQELSLDVLGSGEGAAAGSEASASLDTKPTSGFARPKRPGRR